MEEPGGSIATYTQGFIGHYERTIDDKGRLQLPTQFRSVVDPEIDGPGLYVILGERKNTLALVTSRQFGIIRDRAQTETITDQAALDFEQLFYSTSAHLSIDKQGRVVLPDYLTRISEVTGDVVLSGASYRIDIWRKSDFEQFISRTEWPNLGRFLRGSAVGAKETEGKVQD
jgi:MraZ protein